MSHSDNWTAQLLLLFEEAFGSSVSSPVGLLEQAPTVDVIELAPEGLRIRYSPETALWLSQVAEQPHDTAPIFRHLTMCLSNARHPLGRVCASFLALYHRMCAALGPRLTAARAIGALKLGCARLHRLVLDVLPPLQHAACARVAREAIQTVVFEGEGGTARALDAAQLADDDAALATRQAALRGLRPRQLGLPPQFWLDDGDADGSDDDDEGCHPRLHTGLPYAQAIAHAQTLPELLVPRHKLQLFCDTCAEAASCVERHHRMSSAPPEAGVKMLLGAGLRRCA